MERFELSRRGTPDLPHFECGPFNRLGTSPNLCYIPGPDPPTNSAGGNREEQQDRTSNIIQFELGWNPHGSKGFQPFGTPHRKPDFESFPPCDFWWKLSEDGSTQRKPKSCGILRILASVFRFYLNPQGFPSSSHFCPELWPEDRTRIELDARLGVFTPIPFHENANHRFD